MIVQPVIFDTLQYSKEAQAAGFTQQQAEFQANKQAETYNTHLATKGDIGSLKQSIKNDILIVKNDILIIKNDILIVKHDIIYKLGSTIVASIVVLGIILGILIQLHK